MLALIEIDRERERLHRTVEKWGLRDHRTIRQSEKVDRMIYMFMCGQGVRTQ
ncbi:MAG: Spo0E family sporulation regulatory protein-aspartic acid phosphatase [Bacillota bacterium]|nr:Spo0E family sporulation regulatory protein-aspartic acid phosphatase [Bacillota bacterium]MDW7683734.1 Spo0E family sporulation regulatory protein-aspartic acid phosphatase [Bacillota bacterium]